MELDDLVFLGACALLAPEVQISGLTRLAKDPDTIDDAVVAAKKVWERVIANEQRKGEGT